MQDHADRLEREFGRGQAFTILTNQEPEMTPQMQRLADRMERILTQAPNDMNPQIEDTGTISDSSEYSAASDSRSSSAVIDSSDRDYTAEMRGEKYAWSDIIRRGI